MLLEMVEERYVGKVRKGMADADAVLFFCLAWCGVLSVMDLFDYWHPDIYQLSMHKGQPKAGGGTAQSSFSDPNHSIEIGQY